MSKKVNLLKTSDTDLAAALLSIGFDISGIDKNNPRQQVFYFLRSPKLDKSVNSYWRDELVGSLRSFAMARREILNRIFNE